MGKRKRVADQNETPPLPGAKARPSAKDDSESKEDLSCLSSLRHPRRYGHVYSRRKPINKSNVSTSQSNVTKQDEKLLDLKFDCPSNLPSGHDIEKSGTAVCGPERSRARSLAPKVVYKNPSRMVCGLCDKLLERKPLVLENSVALADLSVVAVLVCGHVYHADCLEPRTSVQDQSDPLCPSCIESI